MVDEQYNQLMETMIQNHQLAEKSRKRLVKVIINDNRPMNEEIVMTWARHFKSDYDAYVAARNVFLNEINYPRPRLWQ